MKKRLVVYLIYDKENIIDSYIGYILKELKTIASSVVVIVQGNSIERGKENLEWADQVYYRKNIGFDVGGFKDALCQLIGWEKVYEFDELVLVNDSFFGPFQSMRSIFEYMNKYDYDFWGITEHALFKDDEIEIPEHIQSYYCTFRNRILHSSEFREYWEQVPYYKNFNEVVQKHEIILTRYFSDFGYKYGCLADMEPNNSEINYKNNLTQYKFLQYELIEKRKCPILKKKPLAYDTLDLQTQENCKLALNYIKNETSYDVDMIWENLIRIMDISDIQKKFHLQYIVKVNDRKAEFQNIKIIVMASYPDAAEYVFERLKYIKEKDNIVVIAPNDFVKSIYEKEGYPAYSEKEIDKFHFWHSLNLERYLVCILHDCDVSNNVEPSCKGKSFFYGIWNNLLDNFDYAKSIINLFNEDKRLGALSPPIPKFSTYFGKLEWEWNYYFTNIQKLLKQKDISCQISKDKMPLTVSSSIWVRGNILKKVYFPREILPISVVTSEAVNFLISTIIIFAFVIFSGLGITKYVLLYPIVFLAQYLLLIAISFIVSSICVYIRDLQHFIGIFLQLLFYATPIVYSTETIPTEFAWILNLNPMTYIINGYRDIFYNQTMPNVNALLILICIVLITIIIGYLIFNKLQKGFAEEL